jgi:nucleoside-diphosphate-sugar epimerase
MFSSILSVFVQLLCFASSSSSFSSSVTDEHHSILITGGAGFLGRYIAHQFCTNNWKVTIVDNLSSEHSLSPQHWPLYLECPTGSLQFIQEDCIQYLNKEESFKTWGIFVHLASIGSLKQPVDNNNNDDIGSNLEYSLRVTGSIISKFAYFFKTITNQIN